MTQQQLAAKIGVSKSQVSNVESGKENLSVTTVEKFLLALIGEPLVGGRGSLKSRVGDRVRRARKLKKLSRPALSALCEVPVSYISDVEHGAVATSLDQLQRVAQVLELNAAQLFDGIVMVRTTAKAPPKGWLRTDLEAFGRLKDGS